MIAGLVGFVVFRMRLSAKRADLEFSQLDDKGFAATPAAAVVSRAPARGAATSSPPPSKVRRSPEACVVSYCT